MIYKQYKPLPGGPLRRRPHIAVALVLLMLTSACSRFLDIAPPKTQLVSESVFSDDLTAQSAMAGLYYRLGGAGFAGGAANSVTCLAALLADENRYVSSSQDYLGFYFNTVLPSNGSVSALWADAYSMVYQENLMLERLATATQVSGPVKNRLMGEAYFLRAFTYYYLARLFGEVPYATTTDYRTNTSLPRTPTATVYQGILTDLDKAAGLLPGAFTGERIYPTLAAALALKARVCLYLGRWQQAADAASEVIGREGLFSLPPLDEVFLKNSPEAIWQLIPSNKVTNDYTNEGNNFIVTSSPSGFILSPDWVQSVDTSDLRFKTWVGVTQTSAGKTYFPYKYKENAANASGAEYSMVLRLAEQFLIRAEARARLGDLRGAAADVDTLRSRAQADLLSPSIAGNQEALLNAIAAERKLELFTEWGHRWFDLVRTGKAGVVLAPIKPDWQETDTLLPVPQNELRVNTHLTQNPGYQ